MSEKDATSMDGFGKSKPIIIQNVGYILFGAWHVAAVVVLMNMLIATMTKSYEMVTTDADIQWKFSRTRLYMDYIPDGSTLPSPVNLIPEPYYFYKCARDFFKRHFRDKKKEGGFDIKSIVVKNIFGMTIGQQSIWLQKFRNDEDSETPDSEIDMAISHQTHEFPENERAESDMVMFSHANGGFDDNEGSGINEDFFNVSPSKRDAAFGLTYQKVIHRIVRRYIFSKQQEDDAVGGDFDELKQDISSFRFEMLNVLEGNGHKVSTLEKSFSPTSHNAISRVYFDQDQMPKLRDASVQVNVDNVLPPPRRSRIQKDAYRAEVTPYQQTNTASSTSFFSGIIDMTLEALDFKTK